LVQAIHPILDKMHLPQYHDNPEFHTSIAWCLLRPSGQENSALDHVAAGDDESSLLESTAVTQGEAASPLGQTSTERVVDQSSTPLTQDLLRKLEEEFGKRLLAAQPAGGWEVEGLELRIGKEITRLPLG
jgi:hypothetical protein